MDARFELPEDLSPEEESLVLQALERYLEATDRPISPWALAGRVAATRQGALQTRGARDGAWRRVAHLPFARPGTESVHGRGDAK